MIILRILWVADVILLAKKDLKERAEEEKEEEEKDDKDSSEHQYFDDYYGEENQMSDHKFLIYFGVQVSCIYL